MNILKNNNFKSSVSSVLNKDVKQHGKAFLFDGCDDTAWSSDQGSPQYITIKFEKPVQITSFNIQFQGGFVGQNATVTMENGDGKQICEEPFYPDDINSEQKFNLQQITENVVKIKFNFDKSSDFFGRIIIYKFEIY